MCSSDLNAWPPAPNPSLGREGQKVREVATLKPFFEVAELLAGGVDAVGGRTFHLWHLENTNAHSIAHDSFRTFVPLGWLTNSLGIRRPHSRARRGDFAPLCQLGCLYPICSILTDPIVVIGNMF